MHLQQCLQKFCYAVLRMCLCNQHGPAAELKLCCWPFPSRKPDSITRTEGYLRGLGTSATVNANVCRRRCEFGGCWCLLWSTRRSAGSHHLDRGILVDRVSESWSYSLAVCVDRWVFYAFIRTILLTFIIDLIWTSLVAPLRLYVLMILLYIICMVLTLEHLEERRQLLS